MKSKGLKTDKEAQEKKFIENLVDAAKKYGKDSVQFQSAMLAPKNAYKNDNDMNRFLVKLSNELSQVKPKGSSTEKNESKKETSLKRQMTAAQYGDRKDEIIGEISKERLKLMNKYGDNWQDDASSKDLERLSSLVSRVNKLGENFNQFGDKSKNSSEHQMTEAQMRAYATARDPKAKEVELNDLRSQLKRAKETVEDIESSTSFGGAAKAEMIRIGKKKISKLEKKK